MQNIFAGGKIHFEGIVSPPLSMGLEQAHSDMSAIFTRKIITLQKWMGMKSSQITSNKNFTQLLSLHLILKRFSFALSLNSKAKV